MQTPAPLHGGNDEAASKKKAENNWSPSLFSDIHDNVNIGVLTALGVSSVLALWRPYVFGNWLTWIGTAYISLDSIWILLQPSIVKSPAMILGHHAATLIVLLDPLLNPSHAIYTAACLLVELNTVLLLLRRKLAHAGWVEVPFLVSWVALRNVWYPALLGYFALCSLPASLASLRPAWFPALRRWVEGPAPHADMLVISTLAWAGVCHFQMVWTRQLFATHPWFGGRPAAAPASASSGGNGKESKYL